LSWHVIASDLFILLLGTCPAVSGAKSGERTAARLLESIVQLRVRAADRDIAALECHAAHQGHTQGKAAELG